MDKEYAEQFLHDAEPGDILILQNEINALDIIFAIAHSKQMQIVFNPSPLQLDMGNLPLDYVNWWFCNEIEGEALFGSSDPQKIAENFIKKYPHSHLILTLGGNGSVFKDADRYLIQPAYKATAVDTTAAGDTFTGFFIGAVSAGESAADAIRRASAASAIAVSRPGAAPSVPTADEVDAFLACNTPCDAPVI
jgi:ribokinase